MIGDPNHPGGDIMRRAVTACRKSSSAADIVHHAGRLNFPLKRAGERGAGKWEQISWDQAFEEITDKLAAIKEKYGAEAVATTAGTGRTVDEYRDRFMNLFGSPNLISHNTI